MTTVVLVPYRPDPTLTGLWDVLGGWWRDHHPDWPMFVADSTGDWSRAEAINRAARDAGTWDVAVIADVCVWQRPETTIRHVTTTRLRGGMTIPYEACLRLNPTGSAAFIACRGRDNFIGWSKSRVDDVRQPHGGLTIIHRDTWDTVAGMDDRFRIWGGEDDALFASAQTLAKVRRGDGVLWQLHHPPLPRDPSRRPQLLADRYRAARGNQTAIRDLIAERRRP